MPIPYHVINKVNVWGGQSQQEEYRNKMQLMSRNKGKYDWKMVDSKGDSWVKEEDPRPEISDEITPGSYVEEEEVSEA